MDYTATTQALALCIAENVPVVLWGKPGQGKALDVNTPIPTPSGWTTMGSLRENDVVFDEMGNPTTVKAVYPQPRGRDSFKVLFDDESYIIADGDHLWETSSEENYRVLTTNEISKSMAQGKEHFIPVARPLYGNKRSFEVPPYEIGLQITSSEGEESALARVEPYLRASVEQRKELLRGMLDTSGYVDTFNDSRTTFSTNSKKVAEVFYELLCSLGHKPSLTNSIETTCTLISFSTTEMLFSDGRDLILLPRTVPSEEQVRKIVSITPYQDDVRMKCITVDSPSKLFLAGKSMIPTHNTSVIQSICANYGIHLETVIASIREPSDFAGLPYFDEGMTRLAAPSWVFSVMKAANGKTSDGVRRIPMVFYDEISTAPPATQAALLRPILEGVVGEAKLPPSTRTVAAANPPGIAADGWDFSPPAANRFTHLDWELDAKTVKEGFTTGWPVVEIPGIPKSSIRKQHVAHAKSLVGVFLGRNTKLVDAMPENFSGMASRGADFKAANYAFPSPRSWEVAARLYAAWNSARFADGSKPQKSVIHLLLTGTVGRIAAKEFLAFAEALDLPDPEALLRNPSSYEVPARGDQLDVLMSSLFSHYTSAPTLDKWQSWGDILATTVDAGKGDIAYTYMNKWNSLRPDGILPSKRQALSLQKLLTELSPDR